MATRRRIGVSAATTEAARRQLMQPVPCWEKIWVTLESTPGSLKVYKWIKTEKLQQFSDDEGEADEPLAPLPDEPEVVEGDEEMDQDDPALANNTDNTQPIESTQASVVPDELLSKPASPKPHLVLSRQSPSEVGLDSRDETLDVPLDLMDDSLTVDVKEGDHMELPDISGLGPDGLGLEESQNLSQLDGSDALMGGTLMDQSIDPFVGTTEGLVDI